MGFLIFKVNKGVTMITTLKFKNCPTWNPETLNDMVADGDHKFKLETEFAISTYEFSKDWKMCNINNTNKDSGNKMKTLSVEVESITFGE